MSDRKLVLSRRQRWDVLDALRTAIRAYHTVHGVGKAEKLPIVKRWMKLCGFVQMSDILEIVAETHNIPIDDIMSRNRDAPTSFARHVVIYLLMERTQSRATVAHMINREPDLVTYALSQVQWRIENEGYVPPKIPKKIIDS